MFATPRPFSIDEYHRLLDLNVLKRGSRTELLDGLVLERPLRTDRQASIAAQLHRRLDQGLPASFLLRAEEPLTLANDTELIPAFSLVTRADAARAVRHPMTASLVVELADALDLERVRDGHLPAYARAGVAEVWLLNLVDRRAELVWKPSGGAFHDTMVLDAPLTLTSRAIAGLSVSGAGLLG
ncbi:MAG: Uma2 family endonuclease [Myxococcaceae bacterium]|nr:Uma2 family endonuclease [Myxococcaceae bacterium]